MNKEAIFSSGTKEFRNPMEPEEGDSVIVRIRTAHGDPVSVFFVRRHFETQMQLDEETPLFDYYRINIRLEDQPVHYLFRITDGKESVYFDRFSLSDEIRWQYPFVIVPGFSTPDWAKGAVMYQIMTDRFCNGDPTNDVETGEYHYITMPVSHVDDWDRTPQAFDVAQFYGGDLAGVSQKLYYLKSLGVDVIYFNPLFVSPSNHKYDIQDYDYIDPHFGRIVHDEGEVLAPGDEDNTHATKFISRVTDFDNLQASNDFFAEFVKEAHHKGIRVILDGVFNHCGSFNKWLDRERIYEGRPGYEPGAYISKDSPYHDYFKFYSEGDWPYNKSYDGWWGHDTLPKLNYEGSEKLCEYILKIGQKWVSEPYNCDGWRLDVAADLGHSPEFNHKFWKEFRNAVKTANPNALILAEHYGDASSWLQGDEWDTIMNYDAFMEPVSYFLTGMEKHSDAFEPDALGNGARFEMTMRHCMAEFMTPSLLCSMNQLSNHDHSRFLTRTNHKVGRVAQLGSAAASEDINIPLFKEAALLQMTWPGAPTLYYGDEAGVCGFTDPDNRRTYPWGHADYDLIDYHRDVILMHRMSPALLRGSFIFLGTGENYLSFGRFLADQQVVVVMNIGPSQMDVKVPVWLAEIPKESHLTQMMITNEKGYSIMPTEYPVSDGMLSLTLPPYTAMALRRDS